MVTSIRKGAKTHLYIEEHIKAKGLSYDIVAGRLGVSRITVWRWNKEQWRLDPGKIDALADALQMPDPKELYRLPDAPPPRPSLDAILADVPDDQFDAIFDFARKMAQRGN